MSTSSDSVEDGEFERELLRGKQVLVVEDSGLLCLVLEESLSAAGCTVLGPYSRLAPALAAVESGPRIDAAVLDINLNGETVTPLAARLRERGVPFVVTSAYQPTDVPEDLQGAQHVRKPYSEAALLRRLAALLAATPTT